MSDEFKQRLIKDFYGAPVILTEKVNQAWNFGITTEPALSVRDGEYDFRPIHRGNEADRRSRS